LLGSPDRFHHRRMPHLQLRRKWLQRIVDPAAEQSGFHRPVPRLGALSSPLSQRLACRPQLAFLGNRSGGVFHAVADAFLVNIESDIVCNGHWVLLSVVSEPPLERRSRYCTPQENPSSFQPLYIQTDGVVLAPPPDGGLLAHAS